MEKWKKQALSLLTALTLEERPDPSVIPYAPSKLSVCAGERDPLPHASPAAVGLSCARLCRLLEALEAEPRANVRALYIVKDGRCVLRTARPGYDVYTRYLSHSMAKSVTGLVIGTLVDEGVLSTDDRVASFFPECKYKDRRFAAMTVEHLLTMSSGVPFAEAGVVTEEHWTQAFFASPLSFAPGTAFMYNSMNSYILGRIAERVSGKELFTLARERLFAPLGIDNALWEKSPEGVAKGGFGLYLSAAAWARLGLLVLSGGVWEGRRLISEAWLARACATQAITPKSLGDFNYGYHLWVSRDGDEVLFNGMLGQNVWISPREGIVAVLLCGNSEMFQQSPALTLLRTHLSELPPRERSTLAERRRLRERCEHFFSERAEAHALTPRSPFRAWLGHIPREPFDPAWEPMLTTYRFAKNCGALLPLFPRLMQNNYEEDGIRSLTLVREGEALCMHLTVGQSEYRVPLGLYRYAACTVTVGGEPYLVRTLAEAVVDADGHRLYKIECIFPELPNARMLYLYPSDDGRLRMDLRESPDHKLLESFRQSFLTAGEKGSRLMALLDRAAGEDFLEERAAAVFGLSLRGVRADRTDAEDVLCSLDREREERIGRHRLLLGLIRRFVGEEEAATAPRTGFLSGLLSSLGRSRVGAEAPDTSTETPSVISEDAPALIPSPTAGEPTEKP